MLKIIRLISYSMALAIFPLTAAASLDEFSKGPVFENYGENAPIENGLDDPKNQQFKVLFDVSEQDKNGGVNRSFNTVARFINMHARAGVPLENIDVAVVIHGKASLDLLSSAAFKKRFDQDNASADLLQALLDSGVQIFLCGQSAAFSNINRKDLIPGITMSLSAMTANALLQQQGFTLNPF